MRTVRILVALLLVAQVTSLSAQVTEEVIRDFRHEWMVSTPEGFRPFDKDHVKKIFFRVDTTEMAGKYLSLGDDRPFAVFLDKKLMGEWDRGSIKWNIDSLGKLYSGRFTLSVYQANGISTLSTLLCGSTKGRVPPEQEVFLRRGNYFLDFSLLASLSLSIYLVFLFRTNPRLTVDYLNVVKLFSTQEREVSLLMGRVTSRVNLLYYLFWCLFCALTLLVVFHLSRIPMPFTERFPIRSTGEGFYQWIRLTALIAGLLVIKFLVLVLFATLFNLRDKVAVQFFNHMRALFLSVGLIALICTFNFVWHGPYGGIDSYWLKIGAGILVLSAGMMYFKLMAMTRYHSFHLFSYLCASEIIPLMILLKILL